MSFVAGGIESEMKLDGSGYGSTLTKGIADAQTFAKKSTDILKQATAKAERSMKAYYQTLSRVADRSTEEQKTRAVVASVVKGLREEEEGSKDPRPRRQRCWRRSMASLTAEAKAARDAIERVNSEVRSGSRSMKAFYETQARASGRTGEERDVRNVMAAKIRSMREEARNTRVAEEVNRQLFGDSNKLREINRTQGEQLVRDRMAAMLRAQRKEAAKVQAIMPAPAPKSGGMLMGLMKEDWWKASSGGLAMKAMMGGGAIGFADMAAQRVLRLATRVEDLALAYDRGEMSGREMAAEILREIPIVGKLGDAIAKTWGLISGETAAVDRIKRETAAIDRMTQSMKAAAAAREKMDRRYGDMTDRMQQSMDRRGKSGFGLAVFDARSKRNAAFDEINDASKTGSESEEMQTLGANVLQARKDLDAALAHASEVAAKKGGQFGGHAAWMAEMPGAKAAVKAAQDRLNSESKLLSDTLARNKAGAAGAAVKAEQEMWSGIIEAGKTGAANWMRRVIVDPVNNAVERLKQKKKAVHDAIVGIASDMESRQMTGLDKQLLDLQRKGANTEQLAWARKQAEKGFGLDIDDLRKQLALSRMAKADEAGRAAKLEELRKKGFGADRLKEAAEILADIDLADDARALRDAVKDPFTAFDEAIAKLTTMHGKGMINAQERGRGIAQAAKGLFPQDSRSLAADRIQGAAAIQRYKFELSTSRRDWGQANFQESQKQTDELKRIGSKLGFEIVDFG